jgi:hypothetical protein
MLSGQDFSHLSATKLNAFVTIWAQDELNQPNVQVGHVIH